MIEKINKFLFGPRRTPTGIISGLVFTLIGYSALYIAENVRLSDEKAMMESELASTVSYNEGYISAMAVSEEKDEEKQEIMDFFMKVVEEAPISKKLSPVSIRSLANTYVNEVAFEAFDNQEERKWFVVLMAIESGFDSRAKSHAGAVGIAQVVPKYLNDFVSSCKRFDLTGAKPVDLYNPHISMMVGGCLFKLLLDRPDIKGDVSLAFIAYNAGVNSKAMKQAKNWLNITNTETANYFAKASRVKMLIEK